MQDKDTFKFKVDKDFHNSDQKILTGRQILELSGKSPDKYLLILKGKTKEHIGPDDSVDLSEPGVEIFRTIARECKEGLEELPPRRQFDLPAQDTAFLNSTGLRWETVKDGNVMRVIIYGYPIPEGYTVTSADIYIRISDQYPDNELDMIYVYPALTLKCGQAINKLSNDNFDGKKWQRWSRHRVNKAQAWDPALDDIQSHLVLVNDWLEAEVRKCA
jgi:hypothetical protein